MNFLNTDTFPQLENYSGEMPPLAKPKPYVYTYSDKLNPPEDWQLEDIDDMYKSAITRGYCANWSEMGCLKTSTGLWMIQRLWKEHWSKTLPEGKHPNVWICTTRSGKELSSNWHRKF